jgi:TPR repeat protein
MLRDGEGVARDEVAADAYFRRACELKTAAPGCGGK